MLTEENHIINNIEFNLANEVRENKVFPREPIVLEDDFIPYIVSKIYVTTSHCRTGQINFIEDNDTFLKVI